MYIFVGLGNPGGRYESTRHNIGFETIDYFSRKHQISVRKIKHKALIGEGRIHGIPVVLVKPQTYMNLSGESFRSIIQFYKVPLENVVVIYDDIDLECGRLRIRKNGGSGTHNGMRSILSQIGSEAFPRIRMGIGKPAFGDLADYVLGRFRGDEIPLMENAVMQASDALEVIIKDGVDKAMNLFNKA
jgi:peptidyl-tRNA hydrolase, PTH1 family